MLFHMSTWRVLKDLVKKNCLIKNVSLVQQEKEKLVMTVKKSDGHITHEEYMTCGKIWDKFDMKIMGNYHNRYLKKMICY